MIVIQFKNGVQQEEIGWSLEDWVELQWNVLCVMWGANDPRHYLVERIMYVVQ